MKQDISEFIRSKRQEKNMTQDQLGQILHVTRQQVSNWETRKQKPRIEYIEKMSNILDFPKEITSYFISIYGNKEMKYTEESFKEIETLDEAIQFTEAMIKDLNVDNNCSETLKFLLSNYLLLCMLYTMATRHKYNMEDNPYDIYNLYCEMEDTIKYPAEAAKRYSKYEYMMYEFESNGLETSLADQYVLHFNRIMGLEGMLKIQFEVSVYNLINHIKEKTNSDYSVFDKYNLEERDLAAETEEYW